MSRHLSHASVALAHRQCQIDLLFGFSVGTVLAVLATSMLWASLAAYTAVALLAVLLLTCIRRQSGFWKMPLGLTVFLIGTHGVVAAFHPKLELAPPALLAFGTLLVALSLVSIHKALGFCKFQVSSACQSM